MDRVRHDAPQQARVEWKWSDAAPSSSSRGKTVLSIVTTVPGTPRAALSQTLERLVIPRLIQSHQGLRAHNAVSEPATTLRGDVERVVRLVLAHDFAGAPACVEQIHARGEPFETLCLDLLAPAARRLGELWDDDRCSFADVTLGMWRLQHVLHELRNVSPEAPRPGELRPWALLIPVPGGQHMLGLAIVIELFRRAGWSVHGSAPLDLAGVARAVRDGAYDVAGISASCTSELEAVAAVIRTIRRSSCNRSIGVMVGGAAFGGDPSLAGRVGADALATDAHSAVSQAEELVGGRGRQIA